MIVGHRTTFIYSGTDRFDASNAPPGVNELYLLKLATYMFSKVLKCKASVKTFTCNFNPIIHNYINGNFNTKQHLNQSCNLKFGQNFELMSVDSMLYSNQNPDI